MEMGKVVFFWNRRKIGVCLLCVGRQLESFYESSLEFSVFSDFCDSTFWKFCENK